jgi:hypothetical protein
MDIKIFLELITLVNYLMYHLVPIALALYDSYDCFKKASTKEEIKACLLLFEADIRKVAGAKGFKIGETESRIICGIVRYFKAKKSRHGQMCLS